MRAAGEVAAGAAGCGGALMPDLNAPSDAAPETDAGSPVSPPDQTDDDILAEARQRRQMCVSADGLSFEAALDDLNFLIGGENQWDPRAVEARKRDVRPIITVNSLPTYVRQVTNDLELNTPSINVHPVGDGVDKEDARIRQGMIRHIEYDSNADVAYATAMSSAAKIGFGYFRIMPTWENESSFNQKLVFMRIRNALSVRIDPLSIQPDGSDMKFAFVECLMSKEEFKREYPDAESDSPSSSEDGQAYAGWFSDQTVLVAEYYRIEFTRATVCLLSDGRSGYKDELPIDTHAMIVREREGVKRKVMWFKLSGCNVLEKTEIKCKWIPVFPVYGDELDVQGQVIRSGIVRNAKGPAQSYNVMMTGATEEVALRTKNPYVGAEGQFEGHEDEWEQANNRAFPYLEYKPTALDGKLTPPPQRQPMADIPAGFLSMAMHAADNVKLTTGIFNGTFAGRLGQRGTATSGVQEREQNRQTDISSSHFAKAISLAVRHAGRCIDCMIPHYYDSERVAIIMREDGTLEHATINKTLPTPQTDPKTGAIKSVLNDMTCGEFSVTARAGPSYNTMRQENTEFFTNAMQAAKDPATASIAAYAAMDNSDAPGAKKVTKMLAAMLPPPAKAVHDEETGEKDGQSEPMVMTPEGPLPASQAGQVIAGMQQALAQAQEQLQKADVAKQQAEALKQQQLINDQHLEPQRQAVEMKKLDAEIAKANAAQAQAAAATEQAKVDMVRAQSEAMHAPLKAEAETHTARANAMRAENELRQPIALPEDPEVEAAKESEREGKMLSGLAEQIIAARPKGADLVIKAPSGMTYDVKATLH